MKLLLHTARRYAALALACLLPFSASAQTGTARTVEPALGTYHWPNGTAGVDAFAAWLGRDTVWGLDFVGGESWSNVGWPVFGWSIGRSG